MPAQRKQNPAAYKTLGSHQTVRAPALARCGWSSKLLREIHPPAPPPALPPAATPPAPHPRSQHEPTPLACLERTAPTARERRQDAATNPRDIAQSWPCAAATKANSARAPASATRCKPASSRFTHRRILFSQHPEEDNRRERRSLTHERIHPEHTPCHARRRPHHPHLHTRASRGW